MCSKLKMEMKMGVSYKGQWRGKIFDKKGVVGKLIYKVNWLLGILGNPFKS